MEQLTHGTRPSALSTNSSAATAAVKSVMAALLSCWPNTKMDRQDSTGVWRNAIADLNIDQVRHGIRELSHDPDDFPPPPGKFRALCMSYRRPDPQPEPKQLHIEDDSPERIEARARMAAKLHELVGSLGRAIPPKQEPIPNVRSRMEQAVCDHDWRPSLVGGDFCVKCDLLESEQRDAFEIRRHLERSA